MSSEPAKTTARRLSAPDIRARKGGEPVVALTAYSATTARLADRHCDFLLVGDSMEMVEYDRPSTLTGTVARIAEHARAVVSATARALVVADMPFGSYEASPEEAFRNAARLMAESGAGAVKLEGGTAMAETVGFLAARGVPVMGHVGLTPQAINALGSFRSQGHDEAARAKILADAQAVSEAGAFALVVEGVVEPLGAEITRAVAIPTIGIGASAACDGQILVTEDMLGLSPRAPRFVRRYADLSGEMDRAFARYAEEVKARTFPGEAETYKVRG